jgi:hypothetical protein
MAITYAIDSGLGVVFTKATGVLTDDELVAHKQDLLRDPAFKPGMVELSDVRGVERLEVTPEGIRRFVAQDKASADQLRGFKLAIVASKDVVYGMARMYELRTDGDPLLVNVFRDMEEARTWLGLSRGS